MAKLAFGEWLPDLPANESTGALLAKNCIPLANSYTQFRGLQSFSSALTGVARGNFWMRSAAGAVFNFAGDATRLYLYDGAAAWTNVSRPATTYSASAWDFISFQDRILATDGGASDIQYYDAGVSTTFDNLPGSPPRGKVLGVVRDFVLIGNYVIGAEVESGGLAWSGFNNTALWTPLLSTQSGRRRTRGGGGPVQRIVSGTRGLVFRENAVLLVSYVGPPNIFQVDDVTTLHGTPAPRSVTWTEDFAFYYSAEGFYQINRRSLELTPIGAFKVNAWFIDNAAATEIVNMQGTVDRTRNLVYWAFKSSSSSTSFDRILVYNRLAQRWAYAELSVEYIGEFSSVGYNLDTIGAILGGNIDSTSISVDSAAFAGGGTSLLGFNTSHQAATFSGAALTAEIDTSEYEVAEGRRGYTNGARPVVETTVSSTIDVAPLTRGRTQDNAVLGSYAAVNAIGLVDLRVNARYQRYRVRIAGGFTHAVRIDLPLKSRGRR